jgi:type IV pilus assembly protein PilW
MPACKRQRDGFSLVELLVAMAITLVVAAGVSRVFIATGHSYRLQDSLARMQENARYVLETLATDLRRAGYWGGVTDLRRIEDNTPAGSARGHRIGADDGSCTGPEWALMLGNRVFGKDDTRRDYSCLPAGAGRTGDILVVRYMAPWEVGGSTTPSFQPRQFYLRGSVFEGKLFRGTDQAAHPVTGAPSRVAELVARAYYIHASAGTAAGCARHGDIPALYRTTVSNGRLVAAEVARGVEQLQVQYGIDSDGDNSVDRYIDAPPASDTAAWHRVIAVRFWILLRGECPETGYTNNNRYRPGNISLTPADGYRRQLYSRTVYLRNRVVQP